MVTAFYLVTDLQTDVMVSVTSFIYLLAVYDPKISL